MNFAPGYVAGRFFYRIFDFFRHWYVGGSRVFAHAFISTLESADEHFAFRITLLHFFQPLYKDFSVIGRILGVIFRSFRLLFGGICYLLVGICFALAYLAWLAIPVILLFHVATGR